MVVADRVGPLAEPTAQRLREQLTVQRMTAQLRPLVVRRPTRLVEDLGGDIQLPDVVQECSPVEAVELVGGEADLAPEARGVPAHALRMTACDAVVDVERSDELKEDLGCFLRVECVAAPQAFPQALDGAGGEREAEARRRLIGEHKGEAEQAADRKKATRQCIERGHDDARENADAEPPAEEHPEGACRDTGEGGHRLDDGDRREDRQPEHREPQPPRSPRTRRPAPAVNACRSHGLHLPATAPAVYPRMEDQSASSATSAAGRGVVAQTRILKIAARA